jgi:hypothetical protein
MIFILKWQLPPRGKAHALRTFENFTNSKVDVLIAVEFKALPCPDART